MDSSAAPATVTVSAATPLYSLPSKITWQRASTWLSALPWMFIAIRSMLNASPAGGGTQRSCHLMLGRIGIVGRRPVLHRRGERDGTSTSVTSPRAARIPAGVT